jgi:hypothetical protein
MAASMKLVDAAKPIWRTFRCDEPECIFEYRRRDA